MLNLTILTVFIFSLLSTIASSRNPEAGLRQELIESIKEIQQFGEPKEFDSSLRELLAQLEQFQMATPHAIQMDWDVAEVSASTNSKSVCIVVSSFEGMYINSGIGTAYYALANLLVSQGHSVTVIYTRDEPTVGGSWDEWVAHHKNKGITLLSLPPTTTPLHMSPLQATSLRVYRYLVALPNFDIVHFADFEGHGFYPTLAKKVTTQFSTTSFVVGLHGPTRWVIESNSARIPSTESEIDIDWMERMSVENADAVWTPSAYMASWMTVQGWTLPTSAHLLPLAPGPEFRDIAPMSTTVQPKEFVYFGRLEVRKGLVLFCDALDLFAKIYHTLDKEITITFLGRSGMVNGVEGSDYVAQRAGKWPFTVKMISDASRKVALDYLMEGSRVAVIPSLSDNAPYTVYECLYAGVPFLASSIPSISPLFADDLERTAHLFEVKPHHIVSKMAGAMRNGLASATPSFTVAKAEAVWTSFYAQVQPKAPVMVTADVPLVSVVITHYNRPELVQQAIASVEAQTYTNIEVVLVDDGSTVQSALLFLDSIEKDFAEKNWKIVRGTNKYLGAARNAGAQAATGKYLLFLDDDNVFAPTAVASYVTAAKLSGAEIVTAGHAVFSGLEAPSTENVVRQWMPLGASLTAGLFKNTFGDANFFVLRSKFNLIGGFTEDRNVGLEEHELFAKAIFNGTQLDVIPEVLLYYRQHSEDNQMLYTTDMRLGEARRLRPYLSALGESVKNVESSQTHQSNRRSLVNLVARNAVAPRSSLLECNATIIAVTPATGPYLGGTRITITGTCFSAQTVTSVKIGLNECTGVAVDPTTITCDTPQGAAVSVAYGVFVVVSGVQYSKANAFTYTPTPPPLGLSAVVDASGRITVKFSVATDQGLSKRSTDPVCARVFAAATLSSIASTTCQWLDAATLVLQLSEDATLAIGDNITIPEGRIRGAGPSGSPNALISLTVQAGPDVAVVSPVIRIATRDVGPCEGITYDATGSMGSGGRKFNRVLWTLLDSPHASADSITAVNSVLAAASTNRNLTVVLSSEQVTSGASYLVQLTLTNWFGKSATGNALSDKDDTTAPIVSVTEPKVSFSDLAATFVGTYSGLACTTGSDPSKASFKWTISPALPVTVVLNTNTLVIPANSKLVAGTTYNINFTVTDTKTGVSGTVSTSLKIDPRELTAKVTGGGSVQYNKTVTLDASGSTDPEAQALTFSWSCSTLSGGQCNRVFTNDAIQIFNSAELGAGSYTIIVTVSGTFARTAEASTSLVVTQIPVLRISINQDFTSYGVSQAIKLSGVIDSTNVSPNDITWQWFPPADFTPPPGVPYPNGLNKQDLQIAANVLVAGSRYTYKLTAQHPSGVSGSAEATFTILSVPPSNATICASPSTSQTYTQQFQFSFGDLWQYAPGVSQFQIFYSFVGSPVVYPATAISTNYKISTRLPVGNLKITGTAKSATKTSTLSCTANIPAADLSLITTDVQTAADVYALGRITFSLYNSKPASVLGTASPAAFLTGRVYIIAKTLTFSLGTLITPIDGDQAVLFSGILEQISNPETNQLIDVEVFSLGTLAFTVFSALRSAPEGDLRTLTALNSLLNVQVNVMIQATRLGAGATRRSVMDEFSDLAAARASANQALSNASVPNPWANVNSVEDAMAAASAVSAQIRSTMTAKLPLGNIITLFTDSTIKTLYKDSPAVIDGVGQSMGVNSTIITPSGIVPTSKLGDSYITLTYLESRFSPYPIPSGFALASAVFELSASDSSTNNFNLSQEAISVIIPDSVRGTNNGTYTCAMYVNNNWTAEGVQMDRTQDGNNTVCTFPRIATFALLNRPVGGGDDAILSTTSGNNASDDGGLKGGAIAGIVIGAVALVAIVAAGSAYGVKKHRDNAAIAVGRPSPRSGDSGAGGVAIDPPLDPIFVPAYMGPMYVPPAAGSPPPVYLNRSTAVNQAQASPVIYGTFQQPAPVEQQQMPPAPVAAAVAGRHAPARNNNNNNAGDFSSDSDSDGSRSRSGSVSSNSSATSRSSRYSRRDSDDDTLSSEIEQIAGELSRNIPRGTQERNQLADRMDL